MPAIKINFTVDMEVTRYISYSEHENPGEIYTALFEESTEDEYQELLYNLVEKDLKDIPQSVVCETSIRSFMNDVELRAADVPESAHNWKSLVPDERMREIAAEKKRKELYEALENATYNNDYDSIIELATQLKALVKED